MITVDDLKINASLTQPNRNQVGININIIIDDQVIDCRLSVLMQYLYSHESDIESGLSEVLFNMARLIKRHPETNDDIYGIYSDNDLYLFFDMVYRNSLTVELDNGIRPVLLKKSDFIPLTIQINKGKRGLLLCLPELQHFEHSPFYWLSFEHQSKLIHLIDGLIIPGIPGPLHDLLSRFENAQYEVQNPTDILDFFDKIFIPFQDHIWWSPTFDLSGLIPQSIEPLALLKITQHDNQLMLKLQYRYDSIDIDPDFTGDSIENSKTGAIYRRSLEMESIYQEDLMTLFLENNLPFMLESPEHIARFQHQIVPELQGRDWIIISDAPIIQISNEDTQIELGISSSDKNWFYFEPNCTIDGQTFSVQEVAALLMTGHGYIKTQNGFVRISEKSRNMMDYLSKQKAFKVGQKLSKRELMPILDKQCLMGNDSQSTELIDTLSEIPTLSFPCDTFTGTLRDYQISAVYWFYRLYHLQQGAILADDMGLGKTIQALAFISQIERKNHILVVCPTNVVFNWEKEIKQFCPSIPSIVYTGSNRSFKHLPNTPSIIITSFGILKNDIELFKQFTFDATIIDEGQFVKNYQTQLSKSIKKLQMGFPIILSGTPIENHIHDLWNLFDIVLPDYLGNIKQFDADIESLGIDTIQQKIKPFILRRQKEDVLDALPEKNEFIIRLKLNDDQSSAYQEVLNLAKRGLTSSTGQKQRMHILTSLLSLRQICNHPHLIESFKQNAFSSSKCEYIKRHVEDLMEQHHQVVIFSQFTKMLDILEADFASLNVPIYRIDGTVPGKKRAELVDEFQKANAPGIFLISLKAGGTGITLTAADYVFHVDPWWNPAVENQATDRIYRIGQTKKVFVYKIVAENTIEEKILDLQASKRAILEQVLDPSGSAGSADRLSLDELKELLV